MGVWLSASKAGLQISVELKYIFGLECVSLMVICARIDSVAQIFFLVILISYFFNSVVLQEVNFSEGKLEAGA